jgi:8-oxo-dGTP pyrophosphatase MutT (NUDIX family)
MIELSAGFVIFRKRNGERKFLLIRSSEHSYWGFPKGVIDKGENELNAALRELKEETGIVNVRILEGFKTTNKYFYVRDKQRIFKTVTYFLAEALSDDVQLSYEHSEYTWEDADKALELIPYPSLKKVLKEAVEFLKDEEEKKVRGK